MSDNPHLSIIVPIFNQEAYLHKCLDSILTQSYNDMEIICVNDGSTDSSQKILEEYAAKDDRIVIVVKENGGLSSARNAGMKVMRGDIVAFIDSDDYIDPDTFKLTVPYMDEYNFVQFNIYEVCRDVLSSSDLPCVGPTDLTYEINAATRPVVWNKLYNANILKEYNLWFPEGLNNEDCMFSVAYRAIVGRGFFINKPLYYHVEHENSIMNNYKKHPDRKNLDQVKVIVPLMDFLVEHDLLDDNADWVLRKIMDYSWFTLSIMPLSQKPMVLRTILSVYRRVHIVDIVSRASKKTGWKTLYNRVIVRLKSKL